MKNIVTYFFTHETTPLSEDLFDMHMDIIPNTALLIRPL